MTFLREADKINWKELSDKELIEQYQQQKNSEVIFTELFRRYKNIIHTYISRFLYYSNQETVIDLVDKVFIKVYLKLSSLKDKNTFKSWLYTIAHNICLDHIKIIKKEILKGEEYLNQAVDERINIEKDYQNDELVQYLLTALKTLDQEIQEIIILKYFQGLTIKEIAGIMHLSERQINYKLKSALLNLEKKLHKGGYDHL